MSYGTPYNGVTPVAALDDQIRDAVNQLLDSLRGQLESTLSSHKDVLVNAAQGEHARREDAAHEADEARLRLTDQIEDLQRSLDERHASFANGQRHVDEIQQEAAAARDEAVAARAESATAFEELTAAREHASTARTQVTSLTRELESVRRQLDIARADVQATLRTVETSRQDSDVSRGEVSRLTDVLGEVNERFAQALRLPEAVRALDLATSFADVLDTVARLAGREAGRAAVFLVKDDRLREWRSVGFDRAPGASSLEIALHESGLMAAAVETGASVPPISDGQVPEFARHSGRRAAAAWPITVGGSVAAVLYADAPVADNPDEPYWPAFLEVLCRHAGRVLEGITVRHAAGLLTGRAAAIPPALRRQASGSVQ